MEKFIRTHDSIWEFSWSQVWYICHLKKNGKHLGICVSDIVKKSDEVTDLFDCYILIPLDQNKKPIKDILPTIRGTHEPLESYIGYYEIYGAIWNEQNILSVAKRNETNGEWELL